MVLHVCLHEDEDELDDMGAENFVKLLQSVVDTSTNNFATASLQPPADEAMLWQQQQQQQWRQQQSQQQPPQQQQSQPLPEPPSDECFANWFMPLHDTMMGKTCFPHLVCVNM